MTDPALVEFLRLCARVKWDTADDERLADAATRVSNWAGLPDLAEAHGLSPLVYLRVTSSGVAIPMDARQRLFAEAVRHRERNCALFRALGEILELFERDGIPVLVLKGAALAHILYATPALRPLSDIDLLVDRDTAARAQSTLAALGFVAPATPTSLRLVSHHHLPVAVKQCDGHLLQVEIHTDAFSRDVPDSLSMRNLTSPPQALTIEGRTAHALGNADMLRHLCRHAAERASLLRLIWIADAVGYAGRYCKDIPWSDLRARDPFVLNALGLLHLVTPLPVEVLEHVKPALGDGLRGIGASCKPLTETLRWNRSLRDIGRDLFAPSDWWLRFHYGVGDGSSLIWQRWVGHPLRVGQWFARRAFAYGRWWAGAGSFSRSV